jgi:ATP-dependent helicase/nuclease subunit B
MKLPHTLYDLTPLEPLIEEGYTLLTPNYRLARRVKAEWDAQQISAGHRVWEPLPVYPLESWLLQRWEEALRENLVPARVPLSQGQLLEVWQQVIAQEERHCDTYHLLRPSAAAEQAKQARETLLRWQVSMADSAIRSEFLLDEDCGTFLRWYDRLESRLAASGQCTPTDCIVALLGAAKKLPRHPIALLDFDDIPPLFAAVVNALADQLHEVQPIGTPARCRAYALPDSRSELEAVAKWAADLNREQPQLTLGIVLSDMSGDRTALEYLLRREFDCLGENYTSLPVNFSTGIPLDQAPVVRDALAVLELGLQTTTVQAVAALLRSRFVQLPDAGSALAQRFVRRLYDAGREQVEVAELRYAASQVALGDDRGLCMAKYLVEMAAMRDLRGLALPSVWAQRFVQVLDVWSWPGAGPLDSLEYQQVELWQQTLEEFTAFDAVSDAVDYAAALQLLRRSCARQMSQPQTPDSNIQVLGPLEAAGLNFDQLWLCGMQGSRWPAAARPNPFIPQAMQRQQQMPHASAEREWAFALGLLNQYQASATELHASYAVQADGVPELPSAALAQFEWLEAPPVPSANASWLAQWQGRTVEVVSDTQAPAMSSAELLETTGGSGLLEDQSQCPFRAFARRRLAVEPLGEFSVALSPGERGSLLHDALFALWNDIRNHSALLALDETAQEAAIHRAVDTAVSAVHVARRRSLSEAYWQLEGARLRGLLDEWLKIERQRCDFAVEQLEQDVELSLGQLQVRLRVDRIDRLADGSWVIIDYKSGLSKVQDWLGERPPRPQLLLYSIAAPTPAAALAFAQLRPRDCRFVGLAACEVAPGIQTDIAKVVKESMDAGDWESLNQRWRENLERLAAEFVAGQAQVDPLSSTSCTWCGLQPLCRIGHGEEAAV